MRSNLESDLKELRETFHSGKTKESSWRISQLQGLLHILEDRESDISMALKQDLGKHHVEAYRDEIGLVVKSINYALGNLKQWMAAKKAKLPLAAFPSRAELLPEPLGVVLIISSWNFPIGLSLEPMIGALAAGNVIEGGSDIGEKLLQHRFDKIFFTGSTRVGKTVMYAATQHLTPVTLELGGKCPVVVDSFSTSWDAKIATKRIVWGKFGACAGQACIGVDYILIEKKNLSNLVELLKRYIKQCFGDDPNESRSISKIINKKQFSRLKSLIDEPMVNSSIVYGGSFDEESLFFGPTILVDPPLDAAIMTEEIFGPLLPIITLERIEESIEFITSRPKPLALYAFTKDEILHKRLVSETSSGSIMFNDIILQYAIDTLPFGGVGGSGFGRYHGKYSFENFSHEKVVMTRSFLIDMWFRYPPWDDKKLQIIKAGFRYDYLGAVLIALGLKRKA
ncbi:unnamed protein product [Lactuca virosa]|uniref:Aldehyde dehydrogenase n=1 Tax=Lactuca virosa TaxID=75947 RepID=A0AAU9PQU2_9ASTR|nr:unnamed protein product [Lactuca virosa]